jgi:hypothetical protein
MPEAFVTLPSLLLALLFATFSLATTLLSFEVNPVSIQPAACSTGRVEAAWSAVRVAAVLLQLLQAYVTPLAALILFGTLQSLVLAFHLRTLPFHSHTFNLLRAGIFATILWAAIASALVASRAATRAQFHWALIALAPVSFALGVAAAHRVKLAILDNAKRIRAEFSAANGATQAPGHARRSSASCASTAVLQRINAGTVAGPVAGSGAGAGAGGRSFHLELLDTFYSVESRGGRAFDSAAGAHAAIRVLLYERDARGASAPSRVGGP